MENILIILFIAWIKTQSFGYQDIASFDDFVVCRTRLQVECGISLDPRSPDTWMNCGWCPGHQMCGADFPDNDGSFRFGTEGVCGGGCRRTNAFVCETGIAVACSRGGDMPQENCKVVPDPTNENIVTNKWCCSPI